ncbi:hypothetical protein Pcinc_000268 [Petrolisthes cinctipes]|uniref:Receptor ligand binding region domain-containing protein n=1 Tax=Petrolisthes cinctipes TaxID=88211 RepID=A0AAE1GPZ8_PETCI|nr:hypothetical protein Pcinc_000268 [Petrolisthes cinctipes]
MEGVILSSLVLFLLQPSQHTEVIIIHDYTLPGVKELVESFSERWAATTILTATPAPDLSQLLVALTSFHTNDLRYMVLLCSANTTWTVFDMVFEKNTAFISGMVSSEIYAIRYLGEGYHLALDTFNPQPYGIACPTGAPYTPILNLMLGRMVQSGLIGKWHRDEVIKIRENAWRVKEEGQAGGKTNVGRGRGAGRPLALDHLQGSFYILGCGVLSAGNVLFIEIFTQLLYYLTPP